MTLFITGGTGFLGSTLAKRLSLEDEEVIIHGRNTKKGRKLEEELGVKFESGCLSNYKRLRDSIPSDTNYIFHCGAFSAPWGKFKDFYDSNVIGTQNILKLAQDVDARVIHVSSPSIYSILGDRFNIKEEEPLPNKFLSEYAKTKYMAEIETDKAHEEGVEVISIRPRAIFGIGDTAIFPRLIEANKRGIPLFKNKNSPITDLTPVSNVVDAMILCSHADREHLGKKYNISNNEPKDLIEVISHIFSELDIEPNFKQVNYGMLLNLSRVLQFGYTQLAPSFEPPVTPYKVGVLAHSQTLNIDAARNDLGYQPNISVDNGIREFIEWYKENN